MTRSLVAVSVAAPENAFECIDAVCDRVHLAQHLSATLPTVIHSELNWRFPLPAANTTPWQLEGAIRNIETFRPLTSVRACFSSERHGDGSGLHNLGVVEHRHELDVRCLGRDRDVAWMEYRPKVKITVLQRVLPDGIILPSYVFHKNLVSLPTAKILGTPGLWGALMGSLSWLGRRAGRTLLEPVHAAIDLVAIQQEVNPRHIWLMDATTVGVGKSLRSLSPVEGNLFLASHDPVALDAVASRLLGRDPMDNPAIRLAHERKLGVGDTRDIQVIGAVRPIKLEPPSSSLPSRLRAGRFGSAIRRLNPHLTGLGTAALGDGMTLYDDVVGWKRHGLPTFDEWKQHNPWGRMFQGYETGRQWVRSSKQSPASTLEQNVEDER